MSVKLLPFSLKSINPIQKYPHFIEFYTCILKIFVVIVDPLPVLLPMDFFICFGMCSTSKLPKDVFVLSLEYRAIQ